MADTITVNTSQVTALRGRMAAAGSSMPADIGTGLRAAGQIVATAAKGLASWSSRIPATITVQPGQNEVTVWAGGSSAPHAAPYEGIAGNATFRHPAYGNRNVWVTQETRPYLVPGLNNSSDQIVAEIGKALDHVIARITT